MKKLSRLLYLIYYLSGRYSVSAVDLARLCRVSQRTISRDINDIQEAGFPVLYHHGYHIPRPGLPPPTTFTVNELQALVETVWQRRDNSNSLGRGCLRKMAEFLSYSCMTANDFPAFSLKLCHWYRELQN
jgi:predicted DNA-binding transcriptional regulator YafY